MSTKEKIECDVVIVDTGAFKEHKHLQGEKIFGVSFVDGDAKNAIDDDIGHGTAIYTIIKRHNEKCRIFNIKAFGKRNHYSIDENDLIGILIYIRDNINCKYVNLSIGIRFCMQKDALNSLCQQLLENGTVVVAAFDNFGCISYPACLTSVIGVSSHPSCTRINDFIITNSSIINVLANGNVQRIPWRNPPYVFISGNSFACAHITGLLSSKSKGFSSVNDVVDYLRTLEALDSFNIQQDVSRNEFDVTNVGKAAIYPFNKETHAILRFESHLPFTVASVYDTKYSCRVGASTKKLLGIKDSQNQDHIISNIDKINWDEFDTLVIGHLNKNDPFSDKKDELKELAVQAIFNGKRVYSFDGVDISNDSFFHPTINKKMVYDTLGMFYKISTPVVGIFGTSSMQGKFTLQLMLRYKFIEKGYSVGQLGTEPSSLLFGMDECLPFGYNNENTLNGNDFISCVNQHIQRISEKNVDIIISGCQSESLNREFSNESDLTLRQHEFLLGLQPDIIVLSVNPFDDINYIKRTILYLESISESKVICISVFPVDIKDKAIGIYSGKTRLTADAYKCIKEQYENIFERAVFNMDDQDDIDKMVELIVEYFSE